jgi:hypothetical protein
LDLLGWAISLCVIALVLVLLLPASTSRGDPRGRCKYNLRQIGVALHNYHDVYGCFPPAYIADERGRPMHSWRVLILPFLDKAPLYNSYRFDEPWDGPHNARLADQAASVFQCRAGITEPDAPTNSTSYVAVIGPRTGWPGAESVRISDITDRTAETLHVVEIANSGIHWMEPRDLHVTQMARVINPAAGMGISSPHVGGAHVLAVDGSVRFVSETTPEETIRRLIERDDGETIGNF